MVLQHFILDWLLQSREMATTKSSSFKMLYEHCLIVFWGFFLFLMFKYGCGYKGQAISMAGAFIYTLIHGVQDWNLWKHYKSIHKDKKDFKYWEDKGFYNWIAIDQGLHFITMILVIMLMDHFQ